MRRKKIAGLAALTALVLGATAVVGCGSGSSVSSAETTDTYDVGNYDVDTEYDGTYTGDDSGYDAAASDVYAEDDVADYESKVTEDGTLGDTLSDETSMEQKLIVTWNLSMETEHYDDALFEIASSVKSAGGYIEGEDVLSYEDSDRSAYFTIRIPNDKAEDWVEGTSEFGTVTNRSKSTQDATLEYVDAESRLNALRTEQETLMGMMEQAKDVSDLITIQTELSTVNAKIESWESQLRVLDNQVNYTTIYLDIIEVNRESASAPQTLGQEIKETFLNSTDNLRRFGRGLLIGILGHILTIAIVAAIIAVFVWLIKKIKNHRKDETPGKERKSRKERRLQKKEILQTEEKFQDEGTPKAEEKSENKS